MTAFLWQLILSTCVGAAVGWMTSTFTTTCRSSALFVILGVIGATTAGFAVGAATSAGFIAFRVAEVVGAALVAGSARLVIR